MSDTTENTTQESTVTTETETSVNTPAKASSMSKIDALIAEAKAKQKARGTVATAPKAPKQPKSVDPDKAKAVEEFLAAKKAKQEAKAAERAAKLEARAQGQAERKAITAAKRAARLAAREAAAAGKPSKLERLRAKLPVLSSGAQCILDMALASDSPLVSADLEALGLHLSFAHRLTQTASAVRKSSSGVSLPEGAQVTVNVGKHAGSVGTVSECRRIRCFVDVPGVDRPLYLFISDVTLVPSEPAAAVG